MPSTSTRLSTGQIADAMRRAGWPENAVPTGVAVAMAESGGNPTATNRNSNGSTDYGLFQINSIHANILKSGTWSNPVDNARMALQVYREAGNKWSPWVAFKSGSYRKYYKANPGGNAAITGTSGDGDDGGFWDGFKDGVTDTATGGVQAGLGVFSLGYLGDQTFWKRFGIGLLAVALIIVGVWIVFRQPIGQAVKGAANLTPQGRAVNVAGGLVKGMKK